VGALSERLGIDAQEVMGTVVRGREAEYFPGLLETRIRLWRILPAKGSASADASRACSGFEAAAARIRASEQ